MKKVCSNWVFVDKLITPVAILYLCYLKNQFLLYFNFVPRLYR